MSKLIAGSSDGKESACNAGDLGSDPLDLNGNKLVFFAWRIPWTEEPDGVLWVGKELIQLSN